MMAMDAVAQPERGCLFAIRVFEFANQVKAADPRATYCMAQDTNNI